MEKRFISTTELGQIVGYEGSPKSFDAWLRMAVTRYPDKNPLFVKIWEKKLKLGRNNRFPLQFVLKTLGVSDPDSMYCKNCQESLRTHSS
jgi:hypothetical protein